MGDNKVLQHVLMAIQQGLHATKMQAPKKDGEYAFEGMHDLKHIG